MSDEKKNIYQKISAVMATIEYLKKDGNVSFGSTNYNYLSEEKITANIRKGLIEHGLTMYPKTVEIHPDVASFEKVVVTYRIVNNDNPEEFIEVQGGGKGQDRGDKSMYKALTGAFKYAQRQTFMISTGDDPDQVSSDEFVVFDGNGNVDMKATEMSHEIGSTKGVPVKEVTRKQIKFIMHKLGMGLSEFQEKVMNVESGGVDKLPQNTLTEIKNSLWNHYANGTVLKKVEVSK
jgi:hypothetical protein